MTMKHIKPILTAAVLAAVFALASCGGNDDSQDPEPELTDRQLASKALSENDWGGSQKVQVTPPSEAIGEEHYADLLDLKLSFGVDGDLAPTSFTATGGGSIFPNVSTQWSWSSFNGASGNVVAISSGSVTQLASFSFNPDVENATSITFTFNYSGPGDARLSDVSGDYTVTLAK